MVRIAIDRWSFWSPETSDPVRWLEYWQSPVAGPAEDNPGAEQVPPMLRRRMSRLAKMALTTALQVCDGEPVDYSIFCSQHGEIVRTREILDSISAGEELSPTAFAQSVHNTSSGLFTIVAAMNAPSMSMASGSNTFAYGWLEAQAYLAGNPKHRVLLVDFDEIIPDEYRQYSDQVGCDRALALLLRADGEDGIAMTRQVADAEHMLPQGPQFLAWLQSDATTLSLASDGQGWQWER